MLSGGVRGIRTISASDWRPLGERAVSGKIKGSIKLLAAIAPVFGGRLAQAVLIAKRSAVSEIAENTEKAGAGPRSSTPIKARSSPGFAFTNTLKDAGIRIWMDGRGRWMDNVFIEWLWRSSKYECVYLNAFETRGEARTAIGRWLGYYADMNR